MKPPSALIHEGPSIPNIDLADGLVLPDAEDADALVFLMGTSGKVVAHVALWWNGTPVLNGARIGSIGAFTATCPGETALLLDAAMERLRQAGCVTAVGPMNGNTWRRHRFVVDSDGRGPFLLEPRNSEAYPEWWREAGFRELSRYSSSSIALDGATTVPPALKDRLLSSGVSIRRLDSSRYDEELRLIHAVSLKSFSSNFLYTPLEEEPFLDAYRNVRERVDPDFVRIAVRGGVPCGFVFGIHDWEASARGEQPALIVKTLAVDPESRCAGLGSLLVDELHHIAREKGFTEAIHALQYETNTSLKITGRHHGRVFRRYALFSKPL